MADNTNRIAGVANVAVDGATYLLVGELTYSPGSFERKSLVGQDQIHGYSEMPRAPFISGTFRDSSGLTVADLNNMTNVTISLELANGKVITGRNMWSTDAQEAKTSEGTIDVRWEGPTGCITES